ncbi:ribonuclease H-like protein [Didymella exigua CBS 183.55]|uniref:Ribonuclease H-like protein n=1 Tax=Didymella exigua CBS 183.55 TaxID=1150837 RepID=A0A6A5R5F8_9PLEO|nr:ribonuclease H-like protein [Didymella exigua CBS 183.55]KAF1923361.1 ribonuclease H-like protein [Didymella exigua CBS 183.55]
MSSQASSSCSKPHGCKDCSRSFATRSALRDHHRSTRHGFHCTKRECSKLFASSAALEAHLTSPAHARPILATTTASTISVRVDTAPAPTQDSPSQLSGRPFPCTVSGRSKIFKTQEPRAPHQYIAPHRRTHTVPTTQAVLRTMAQTGQHPATVTSGDRNQSGSNISYNALGIETILQQLAVADPVLHSANSVECLVEPVNTLKPARSSVSNIAKAPVRVPLFRWDTRWSKIPSTDYGLTVNALRAVVTTPESRYLTGVDKSFWTPDHKQAPPHDWNEPKRQVIVLDCEMVGIGLKGTTSELARLSAVDFLTGELLIDALVEPVFQVTDMRTKWSGIKPEAMEAAMVSGSALKGSTAARTDMFNHMDSQTILVGHSIQYDLAALGIRHGVTVDSATLAEAAVGKEVKRRWGLKTLCKELLGITIQDNGKNGHDSIEDTLATREVVLWCLNHQKELKAWGDKKRKENQSKRKENNKWAQRRRNTVIPQRFYGGDTDDYEFHNLNTRELNDLCGYPDWYDNWD